MWVNASESARFPGMIAFTFAVPSLNNVLRHLIRALADVSQGGFGAVSEIISPPPTCGVPR
ncbi:hypothetical protein [Mycobacterium sp.]|uniref:hypothetical protein n=1 Tax=Mycobacterium sp. TaxID=1785 RepID=UPI003C76770A